MNLFVYDDYVSNNRYQKTINKLETRLTDLGLSGKIIRLNNIKNVDNLIHQEIRAGIKNIYIVGNNESAAKVINSVINEKISDLLRDKLVLAMIPIGKHKQSIANSMGIYDSQDACNIILARLIKKIDLGLVNSFVFVNKVEIFNSSLELNFFDDYSFNIIKKTNIQFTNLLDRKELKDFVNISADDRHLDLLINKKGDLSYIKFKKVKIKGAKTALLDDHLTIDSPSLIQIADNQINFIVGKNRSF